MLRSRAISSRFPLARVRELCNTRARPTRWLALVSAVVLVRYRVNSVWLIVVVTVPAIVYLWSSGTYSTAAALAYTVALVLAGMADTGLKPLMLGRGGEAPMPVMLLGAL